MIDRLGMRFLLQYNKDRFCSIVYLKNVIIMYGGKNEACQYVVGLKMSDCFGFQSVMVE